MCHDCVAGVRGCQKSCHRSESTIDSPSSGDGVVWQTAVIKVGWCWRAGFAQDLAGAR